LTLLKGNRKNGMDRRNIEKINNDRTDKKEAKKM
jgi:hypothetical protein